MVILRSTMVIDEGKRAEISDGRRRTREIIHVFGWNATAYQILNPGMTHWFSEGGDAVAGYVRVGRTLVVAGAPVCDEARLEDVANEFEVWAGRQGMRVMYFGAGSRLEVICSKSSRHSSLQIGAQPVWNPMRWRETVAGKSSLRAQFNRARNKGVSVEIRTHSDDVLEELGLILTEWLSQHGLPPMQFMVEPNILNELEDRQLYVARRDGEIDAFLIATPVPARNGWLIEEWPRRKRAVNGTTHLLVDAAMNSFASAGSEYATLGLVPLSDAAGDVAIGQPVWLRMLLRWLRAHGTRFYNFRGLEAFKASMVPDDWEPIHIITQGERFSPWSLRTAGGAFSGGSPELLVLRGLGVAVRRECERVFVVGRG